MQKAIPYYRVSTQRQGNSGLGLEAQKQAVQHYAACQSLDLSGDFVEVESGKKNNRPVLQAAIVECRKQKAVLLIAKLDRLARNVSFIAHLMDANIDFIAVDNPTASRIVLHIMAAIAEHERDQISQRTKAALEMAKRRGVALGTHGRNIQSKANRDAANVFALKIKPKIDKLKQNGFVTVRKLTKELNRRRIKPFSGGTAKWHTRSVYSVLKRIEKLTTRYESKNDPRGEPVSVPDTSVRAVL